MIESWRLPGTLLPDGHATQLWIAEGRLTNTPIADAEPLPGRFALPGLVDAHCHLALGRGFRGLGVAGVVGALREARDRGVLLIRDVGAPGSITLDVAPDPTLPELHAAGRWFAPEDRFFAALHDPVSADELVAAAMAELAHGARWIKIIADWAEGEGEARKVVPSYDVETLRLLVDAVHAAGARVATHTQSPFAKDLVAIGVDSIEHGTWLDESTLREMAGRGTAWTPTLTAIASPMPEDAPKARRRAWLDALDNVREMVPLGARLGVTILAGTDASGTVAEEVAHLREFGLEPAAALRAATTAARTFLGAPAMTVGAPADVVTYDADPREHPEVLDRPAAVVLRGQRIS